MKMNWDVIPELEEYTNSGCPIEQQQAAQGRLTPFLLSLHIIQEFSKQYQGARALAKGRVIIPLQ